MENKAVVSKKIFCCFFAGVLALVVLGAVAWVLSGQSSWVCQNGQWAKQGFVFWPRPIDDCANSDASLQSVSPSPSLLANENLTVSLPFSGQTVSLPIQISGTARVFESVVSFRIKDQLNQILYQGIAMANAPDMGQFGPFEKTIEFLFALPASEDIWLEVYWASPKDGSDLDLISIPLKIVTTETKEVQVFFNNNKMDPEYSCNRVFPVRRLTHKIQSPAQAAMEILLAGPGWQEMDQGYFTSINSGVAINSLKISGGRAEIDFNKELEREVGGSCRVSAIRAQIIQTLKQFSTINDVVISIDGRTEDILQP